MFRNKKSPQAAAIEKEAKACYKFIEKHKDGQFEIDLFLNTIADKELGKEILQKVLETASANIAAIKLDNKKMEAVRKVHQLAKDRVLAAMLRKAAFESMVSTIKNDR